MKSLNKLVLSMGDGWNWFRMVSDGEFLADDVKTSDCTGGHFVG
jgi:hypothetical protein